MKRLLLLFIPLMFFFGCEDNDNTMGYNCAESGCVEGANGYYLNLEDCENTCNAELFCLDTLACNYGAFDVDCQYVGDTCSGTTDTLLVFSEYVFVPDPVTGMLMIDTLYSPVFASYFGVIAPEEIDTFVNPLGVLVIDTLSVACECLCYEINEYLSELELVDADCVDFE